MRLGLWYRMRRPRLMVELTLWRIGLRRLSLAIHRDHEPLFYFQIPPESHE